ncbi:MAG: HAMP domain-containing sensor histidine kinase [Phycisphaeraceae bacterium]
MPFTPPFLPLAQTHGGVIAVLIGAAMFAAVMLIILIGISRSIRRLRQAADRLAQGDLSRPVDVTGPLQLSALAEALNRMAQQLQQRLDALEQQRNEMGALLWSMVEGVLAIDTDEQILSLNRAAADLLKLDPTRAIGRPIHEAVRNPALQEFVTHTLSDNTPQQTELTLRRTGEPTDERHLQAQSAILRDSEGHRIGAVLVLHDVTRLRRLEVVRRDFVANVSHEVKTPVSAIKTAVETLLHDAPEDPDAARRFLEIINRQSDRLAAIVDDLLSLARIEQADETGEARVELETHPVADVLNAAMEACAPHAEAKRIALHLACDAALTARMNRPLMEQAVVNLVDNAIKYSPERTRVTLAAEATAQEVVLAVTDEGRGIEPAHLPRIFERFYRTDKARSRALGGTGLGLSIVKHVAQAHGGRVSVDSTPGAGSTFQIHLPRTA